MLRLHYISFNRAINTSPYIVKHGKLPKLQVDNKANQPESEEGLQEIRQNRDQTWQKYEQESIVKGTKLISEKFRKGDKILLY